jgi:hypothetical protein
VYLRESISCKQADNVAISGGYVLLVGTKPVFHAAECTHNGDANAITIWELLAPPGEEASNLCRWKWGNPEPGRITGNFGEPPNQDCTSFAYGKDCTRITGGVNIIFAVIQSWTSGTANSRMEEFWQRLGLENVTDMSGWLSVQNLGVNTDANLTLHFFRSLR